MKRPSLRSSALVLIVLFSATDACMKVTPGEPGMPATPCKNCAANLIAVTTTGAGAKPMDGDMTVKTGACAVRTFTCKGKQATIEIFGPEGALGQVDDTATPGTTTLPVTCNAAGTAWQYMGMTINRVECSAIPGCRSCAEDQVAVTMMGAGSKPMATDDILFPNCMTRKFTCTGLNANIEIFKDNRVMFGTIQDMGTGTATFEIECKADGSGWFSPLDPTATITSVECSAGDVVPVPLCKMCTDAMIPATTNGPKSKPFTSMMTSMAGACSTRTFVCDGQDVLITLLTGTPPMEYQVYSDPTKPMSLDFTVTCNAAGTGWESNLDPGTIFTGVECVDNSNGAPVCQQCTKEIAPVILVGDNVKAMDNDVITVVNGCNVRTLTCMGNEASVNLFTGMPPMEYQPTNMGTFEVKCNAAGTGWESDLDPGTIFTGFSCTTNDVVVVPAECTKCTMDMTAVTTTGPSTKMMDGDMIDDTGACAIRRFTCTGTNAAINLFQGMPPVEVGPAPGATPTEAVYTLVCNGGGTGWESADAPGNPITAVECQVNMGG